MTFSFQYLLLLERAFCNYGFLASIVFFGVLYLVTSMSFTCSIYGSIAFKPICTWQREKWCGVAWDERRGPDEKMDGNYEFQA